MKYWLTAVILITLFTGLAYSSAQHILRSGANDPQVQVAEDAADLLAKGQRPDTVVPRIPVDIESSLRTFVILYDRNGRVTTASAFLTGKTPNISSGVLYYTKTHGEDRLTWQPKERVRIATVVTSYNNGFVLVGRNMREVEKRENDILLEAAAVWLVAVLVVTGMSLLPMKKKKK